MAKPLRVDLASWPPEGVVRAGVKIEALPCDLCEEVALGQPGAEHWRDLGTESLGEKKFTAWRRCRSDEGVFGYLRQSDQNRQGGTVTEALET